MPVPVSPARLFAQKKSRGEKIAMISLYDAPSAQLACDAGADVLLVGDSMGNVVLGYDSTVPVTLDDMARATGAVVRGVKSSSRPDVPVIADLPFATYATPEHAVESAARLMREGASGVKLEGLDGIEFALRQSHGAGIPVMVHLGYTPQSHFALQSIVQGRQAEESYRIIRDAREACFNYRCFAVLLEAVTAEIATEVTRQIDVPTIGIGSGLGCDGQVLIWHDLIGLSPEPPLKFVKRYANIRAESLRAAQEFVREVQGQEFPTTQHSWQMTEEEKTAWRHLLEEEESERQGWAQESDGEV